MSLPDHMLDEPDELPCRDCYDEEHKPNARALLVDILENIGLDGAGVTTYTEAAVRASWWQGFVSMLDGAYSETVEREEWGTCAEHADAARN